jgi:hypothetical protein
VTAIEAVERDLVSARPVPGRVELGAEVVQAYFPSCAYRAREREPRRNAAPTRLRRMSAWTTGGRRRGGGCLRS